jgi:hypothetical protein
MEQEMHERSAEGPEAEGQPSPVLESFPPPELPDGPAEGQITPGPGGLRKVLRWITGLTLVFGLGVLAAFWLLLRPLQEDVARLSADLAAAQEQAASLQAEVDNLRPLAEDRQVLEDELSRAGQQLNLLRVLVDISTAQIGLALGDTVTARAALSGTDTRLASLESSMSGAAAETIGAMRARLALAQREIDQDSFAARNDLETLANTLLALERSQFGD